MRKALVSFLLLLFHCLSRWTRLVLLRPCALDLSVPAASQLLGERRANRERLRIDRRARRLQSVDSARVRPGHEGSA